MKQVIFMPTFSGSVKFKGEWRPYQKRIIDNLRSCAADKKIHIVAAPGSGKTTVGLEIIRQLDRPALILSPSVTIREQWIERFCKGFLPENAAPEQWVSNTIKAPRPITAITYQALHCAYTKYAGDLENEEDEFSEKETADYSDFNLIAALKEAGIKTICLDEAHHLRSEWWKALEKVVQELGDSIITVSLTATPPYDSKPAEWQRYINLCGEIDTEIFTPELVKDNNLCPHQDYIYFNWPEKDETEQIKLFKQSAYDFTFQTAGNPDFVKAVCSHKGIRQVDDYAEMFLDHPTYLTSLMVFMNHNNIALPADLRDLIGTKDRLPKLDTGWMEILLQGFLFDDCESYPGCEELQDKLRKYLSAAGHIYRKTVFLTSSEAINKLLVTSKGKLKSIIKIVQAEYGSLGNGLRMLILTDYIKKDAVSCIGTPEEEIKAIGTVPIFELLRREGINGLKLGVLSGGIVIVPKSSALTLTRQADRNKASVNFKELKDTGYVQVDFTGSNRKQMVSIVTDLFSAGEINTLIGTKSLLGEGWDSPCVNALILASFVGSYMLSNQMRGRAIRVCPGVPDKTSNIWHLVSMEPLWAYADGIQNILLRPNGNVGKEDDYPVSEDFDTMRRRFKSFLGVGYTENVIQDGVERLSIIKPPYDQKNIEAINEKMLEMAADRKTLRERWCSSIAKCPDASQVVQVNQVEKEILPQKYLFFNAVAWLAGEMSGQIAALALLLSMLRDSEHSSTAAMILVAIMVILGMMMIKTVRRMVRTHSPDKSMELLANAVMNALKQINVIQSNNAKAITEHFNQYFTACYLDGGTTYEKNIFADCISQIMGPIDNPRYLLIQYNRFMLHNHTEYYAVPEIFGNKKENAEVFGQCLKKYAGDCRLLFTRNPEGRKVLLTARTKSFVNKNDSVITNSRRVKTNWE